MSEDARSVLESVVGGTAGARALGARGGLRRGREGTGRVPGRRHVGRRRRPVALPARARPDGDRGGARAARRRDAAPALLSALGDPTRGIDPARLAHHAEAADDALPVLQLRAGRRRRAAAVGAHREAAAQYARALRFAAAQPPAGGRSSRRGWPSAVATDDQVESIAARQRGDRALRAAGDAAGEGDALCHLVTSCSCRGMMADARAAAEEALRVLEPLDPSPALGAAYDSLSLLALYRPRFRRRGRVGRARGRVRRRTTLSRLPTLSSRRAPRCCCATARTRSRCSMRGLEVAREHGLEQRSRGHTTTWRSARCCTGRTRWQTRTSRPASGIAPSTTSTCGRCRCLA